MSWAGLRGGLGAGGCGLGARSVGVPAPSRPRPAEVPRGTCPGRCLPEGLCWSAWRPLAALRPLLTACVPPPPPPPRVRMNEEQFVSIDLDDDNVCSVCKLGTERETLSFCHVCFELNIEGNGWCARGSLGPQTPGNARGGETAVFRSFPAEPAGLLGFQPVVFLGFLTERLFPPVGCEGVLVFHQPRQPRGVLPSGAEPWGLFRWNGAPVLPLSKAFAQ